MPHLKDMLAKQAEAARADRARQRPATGAFSGLENRTDVRFTTTGRRTGQVHEKWWLPFAPDGDTVYLLEERGEDADWVRNGLASGSADLEGHMVRVRLVSDPVELQRARRLCAERFQRVGLAVQDLVETGLVIAFDAT